MDWDLRCFYARKTISPDAEVGRLARAALKETRADICGQAEKIDGSYYRHRE